MLRSTSFHKRKLIKRITWMTLKLLLAGFVIVFIIFPLVFRYSYKLQRQVIFLNSVNLPYKPDYDKPEKYGLPGVRNFYITTEKVTLGAWHIIPEDLIDVKKPKTAEDYLNLLKSSENVVIYNHGNAGNRLSPHRIELYKLLRQFFHVIAYDYRSYGDSTKIDPDEDGVVEDAINVFKWVSNYTKGHIFVWGHSLGSGVTLHSLADLKEDNYTATGVILEGAFNNLKEEIGEFPLARMFNFLPWFHFTVVEPMQENGFLFLSETHISKVDCPILLLHAEDDHVVPYKLGYKLYIKAKDRRRPSQGPVILKKFEAFRKYGHKFICRAPELPAIIQDFQTKAIDFQMDVKNDDLE